MYFVLVYFKAFERKGWPGLQSFNTGRAVSLQSLAGHFRYISDSFTASQRLYSICS